MKNDKSTDPCGCGFTRPARPQAMSEIPGAVKKAIDALAPHEEQLLKALEDHAMQKRFLEDPLSVLRRLKLPVPAALDHFLRGSGQNRKEDLEAKPIVLPNGQRLTPRIRVRITRANKEG